MARVQDIETAVGQHDLAAVLSGPPNQPERCFLGNDARAGPAAALIELGQGHGRGAEFFDHEAGRAVGERRGLACCIPRGQGRGQRRDHRIARAGHVIDLVRLGRQMQGRRGGREQAHAAPATGDQQGLQIESGPQARRPGGQFGLIREAPGHGLKFLLIGRQDTGPAVTGKIGGLGIHQHARALFSGIFNELLDVQQAAFCVIRQDDDVRLREQRLKIVEQPGRGRGPRFGFIIQAQ